MKGGVRAALFEILEVVEVRLPVVVGRGPRTSAFLKHEGRQRVASWRPLTAAVGQAITCRPRALELTLATTGSGWT